MLFALPARRSLGAGGRVLADTYHGHGHVLSGLRPVTRYGHGHGPWILRFACPPKPWRRKALRGLEKEEFIGDG